MICSTCGHGLQKTVLEKKQCEGLKDAIDRNGGNWVHTARELNLSLTTVKRMALKHGLRKANEPIRDWKHKCPVAVAANNGIEPS